MKINQNLPTIFAISLAKSVELMPDSDGLRDFRSGQDAETRLAAFQQMSIGCSFEDALIAYHGVDLTEEQRLALEVVYKSTTPWLIGHVVGELMDSMSSIGDKGKTAELILSELLKDGKVNPDVAKELIVKLQVLRPDQGTGGKK